MVHVHQLHPLGQRREGRLEAGVIAAGAAVEQEGCWPLDELWAVWDEGRSLDVEEDLGVTNPCAHATSRSWDAQISRGWGVLGAWLTFGAGRQGDVILIGGTPT